MAWNDLPPDRIPSYADLLTSGFTLNPGQSNPGTDQCVNKAEALTLYNLDVFYMVGYTNNQLVPKLVYAPGTTSYVLNFSTSSAANDQNACVFGTYGLTLYAEYPDPGEGTQLYTNPGLTTTYVGNNAFRKYELDDYNVYRISTTGFITLIAPCSI